MAYNDLILQSNPKYYFRFDNGSVQNVGSDTSITIDVGANTGFPTTGGILNSGKATTANYDNTNYGLTVNQQATYIADKIFTVSGWFKVASSTDLTTNNYILRTAQNVNQGVILNKSNGNMVLYAVFGNAQVGGDVGTSPSLAYNVWHHFAVTCDTSNIKLYIDGALIDTKTAPSTTPADGIQYWFRYTGSTNRYGVLGEFDEMALFDSTLSASTIASHYDYVNGATISASPATASSLFVNPAVSASVSISVAADVTTASALMPDHQVSNFNIETSLENYMANTAAPEQWYKFDAFPFVNSGSGGNVIFTDLGTPLRKVGEGPDKGSSLELAAYFPNGYITTNTGTVFSTEVSDSNFSLGTWFKFDSNLTNSIKSIMDILATSTSRIYIRTIDKKIRFGLVTSTNTYEHTTTAATYNDNAWHFGAIRWDGTNLFFYLDGSQVYTTTTSGTISGINNMNFGGIGNIADTYKFQIAHPFIGTYSGIDHTKLSGIWNAGTRVLQGGAGFVEPKITNNNAYNDYVESLSPVLDLRFNDTGAPINYSTSTTVAFSVDISGTNYSTGVPTKNTRGYNFTNKNTGVTGNFNHSTSGFSDNTKTVSMYAKMAAVTGLDTQVYYTDTQFGANPGISINATAGGPTFGVFPTGTQANWKAITAGTSYYDGNYHLFTAVRDGSNLRFYVDGKLVGSDTITGYSFSNISSYAIGGLETIFFGASAATVNKNIDEVQVYDYALTGAQIFEMWQKIGVDTANATNATFPTPVGIAGSGVTIHPGVMYASVELPDPTQQDTVAPTILPMTAFITTVTPNFAASSNVSVASDVMTASGEIHDPTWSVGEINSVTHMHAAAEMGDHKVFIPGFFNANPMIANQAQLVMPGFASTQGGLVLAEAMKANAVSILPPAYKTLFDDKWYDLLYSQHSQRHNFRAVNGGNGEAILKLFDDVTTDKAVGSTIKNNLPTTITSDGINVSTAEPNMNVVAEFTPSTNTPLIGIGFFDSYERKAVRINNITTGYEDSEYITTGFSLELSIKTTKENQIIAFGRSRNFYGNQQYATSYGLSDGKLFLKSTAAIGPAALSHYKEALAGDTLIGNKNIADGQWHHIVIQSGWDDNRVQFWIDGELDRQKIGGLRLDGPSFLGFNSQVATYASDFQTSAWSYDSHRFPREHEIDAHRYAYIKYEPVLAQPMLASATSGDHLATSNRARALMLYWWPTDSFQNPPLTTKQFNTAGFPDIETWTTELTTADFIKSGPQEYYGWDVFPVDITGYFVSELVKPEAYGGQSHIKVGSKPFIGTGQNYNTNPEYLYNDQGTFKDPVTDAPRYIDLIKDIDLRQFDAIFFKNFPDDTKEKESYTTNEDVDTYFGSKEAQLYDQFISSLREAVDTGISLYVTNPQLAIDLGIIDRVETVPDMDEMVGFDSDPYTPTIVPGNAAVLTTDNAAHWADTYKNNRLRVVNTLEGFTTEPSFIRTDRAYYYNDDANQFGAPNRPFTRFVYRPNGLQVGDELIIANDPQNALGFTNARNYLGVPFANVKAGTVITAFANTVKRGTETITNPYANYATCIVVEPGDELNGTQSGGKIVVNFTENLNGAADWGDVDLVSDYWINVAYNDGFITETQKNTYLAASYNIDRQLENNTISQTEYNKLAFWSSNGMNILGQGTLIDDPTASTPKDGIGMGARETYVTKTRKSGTAYSAKVTTESQWFSFSYSWRYPRMGIKVPSILTRGFWWLSNRESYDGIVERPLATTASAVFVEPVVTGQKDRSINAQAMIASATIVQSDGTRAAAVNIAALPMQAVGIMGNLETRYVATPMTATAILRTNNRIFTTAVDEVVVYVYHTDPILYIREDVIK